MALSADRPRLEQPHRAHGSGTEIEARGALEAWKRSGMSLEAFARSRGIVPQRLHWWKKKLRFGVAAVKESALVPVRIVEAPHRRAARRAGHGAASQRAHAEGRSRLRRADVRARRRAAGARLMFGLPPSVRIYFATELTDMRNGIDGLRARVEGALRHDPYEGHLFVFVGKSKDKVKILFWHRSGFLLYMKRLEKGRFQLPVLDARRKHVQMEPAQLAMLLDGIDLNARRLARWTPTAQKAIDKITECDQNCSMVVPPVDHDCSLLGFVTDLADRLAKLEHENAQLKKSVFGSRSERASCRGSRPASRRRPSR